MTSVYLMIEVETPGDKPPNTKDRENARRDVDNLVMEGLINNKNWKTKDAVFKHAVILPDDMPEVLKMAAMRGLTRDQMLKRALALEELKEPIERWNELIARGAIDEEGNVLLKSPWIESTELARSPKTKDEARKSLQDIGIIDENGELTERYKS